MKYGREIFVGVRASEIKITHRAMMDVSQINTSSLLFTSHNPPPHSRTSLSTAPSGDIKTL